MNGTTTVEERLPSCLRSRMTYQALQSVYMKINGLAWEIGWVHNASQVEIWFGVNMTRRKHLHELLGSKALRNGSGTAKGSTRTFPLGRRIYQEPPMWGHIGASG